MFFHFSTTLFLKKYPKDFNDYYDVGDFDSETRSYQVGSSDQIIKSTEGLMTNFIIVASTDVEGLWHDPQSKRFPYN